MGFEAWTILRHLHIGCKYMWYISWIFMVDHEGLHPCLQPPSIFLAEFEQPKLQLPSCTRRQSACIPEAVVRARWGKGLEVIAPRKWFTMVTTIIVDPWSYFPYAPCMCSCLADEGFCFVIGGTPLHHPSHGWPWISIESHGDLEYHFKKPPSVY